MVISLLLPLVLLITSVVTNGQRRCQVTSRDVEGPFFEAGKIKMELLVLIKVIKQEYRVKSQL